MYIVRDPFRRGDNILVLCETLCPDGVTPHPTNKRHACKEKMDKAASQRPWFGIEQVCLISQLLFSWVWKYGGIVWWLFQFNQEKSSSTVEHLIDGITLSLPHYTSHAWKVGCCNWLPLIINLRSTQCLRRMVNILIAGPSMATLDHRFKSLVGLHPILL